jgi:hypothetical protein
VVLEAATRGTLRDQLAAITASSLPPPPADELRLARAVWSRAEQVVSITASEGSTYRVQVLDALTGQVMKSSKISKADDDDALRREVCDALGETCEPRSRGVPWYVWPIGGLAVVGGVVSAVLIANANRSYRFVACPAGMSCQ